MSLEKQIVQLEIQKTAAIVKKVDELELLLSKMIDMMAKVVKTFDERLSKVEWIARDLFKEVYKDAEWTLTEKGRAELAELKKKAGTSK